MKIRLSSRELQTLLDVTPPEFPKYATQLINLANQNAQGTRPKVVGQQTELIREFPGNTLFEWEQWYLERYPEALGAAADKIFAMVEQLKASLAQIDRPMIEAWVKDLVLVKTFLGLRFQEAILKKIAGQKDTSYRFSSSEEEARGIDGYIGDLPVSIKPDTYKAMAQLPESIDVEFVFYTKLKDGIALEYDF